MDLQRDFRVDFTSNKIGLILMRMASTLMIFDQIIVIVIINQGKFKACLQPLKHQTPMHSA